MATGRVTLKVIDLKIEAQKNNIPIEHYLTLIKKHQNSEEIPGIITADKTQLISYQEPELEDFIVEISSGKVSLANLAEQFNLNVYQVHAVAEHLLKTGRINGELTYLSFNSSRWAKKENNKHCLRNTI